MSSASPINYSYSCSLTNPYLVIVLGLFAAASVYHFSTLATYNKRKGGAKELPGPKGSLLLGNKGQLPSAKPWIKMKEWADEYGPIYKIRLGSQNVVVVSSAKHAIELLDKRSPIYSSRPRQVVANDLISKGLRLTFMPFHDLWKKERKLIHKLTSPQASSTYEPLQELESTQLMLDMLTRPAQFWGHCQRYAGSLIMQIAFDKRASKNTDPAVADMRALLEKLTSAAVPGRYLVDSLPFLNYLPSALAPWKSESAQIFKDQQNLFGGHMRDVENSMKNGQADASKCFVKYLIQEGSLEREEIAFLAGVMYGAGSDTTSDAISTFIMSMVNHPEQQAKAQAEIDSIVGRNRMPEFSDQKDLKYVSALVKEVQRWRPVIAGGLAHASIKDDVYEGYFIPEGTTILPNAWAIHMDPELYPEPELFKPERFMNDKEEVIGVPLADRGHFGFGYGRRICPGMYIAERSLFIVFARMLWGFNISNAKDRSGNTIAVNPSAYTTGFSSHPQKFQCSITPRDAEVENVIRAQADMHSL